MQSAFYTIPRKKLIYRMAFALNVLVNLNIFFRFPLWFLSFHLIHPKQNDFFPFFVFLFPLSDSSFSSFYLLLKWGSFIISSFSYYYGIWCEWFLSWSEKKTDKRKILFMNISQHTMII